jgi:hypothetical protein
MNEEEVTAVLKALKAAYPYAYKGLNRQQAETVITAWTSLLYDTPLEIVLIVIEKFVSISKFPPTIAEVRKKIKSLHFEALEVVLSHNRDILPAAYVRTAERFYEMTCGFNEEPTLYQQLNNVKDPSKRLGIPLEKGIYLLETGLIEDKEYGTEDGA